MHGARTSPSPGRPQAALPSRPTRDPSQTLLGLWSRLGGPSKAVWWAVHSRWRPGPISKGSLAPPPWAYPRGGTPGPGPGRRPGGVHVGVHVRTPRPRESAFRPIPRSGGSARNDAGIRMNPGNPTRACKAGALDQAELSARVGFVPSLSHIWPPRHRAPDGGVHVRCACWAGIHACSRSSPPPRTTCNIVSWSACW